MLAEALAAVDRTVILRLERDFCLFAAIGTDDLEHLAFATLAATTALVAAIAAALRLVFKALLCVEFLFTCGENKFLAAILTCESLVLKSHKKIPLNILLTFTNFSIAFFYVSSKRFFDFPANYFLLF